MNPLILEAFKRAIPYVIFAGMGFMAAWYIQGLRITSAKQEFTDFKQDLRKKQQDEKDRQTKINEETTDAWHKNLDALHDYYRKRMLPSAGSGGNGLSKPSGGTDASGQDAIPAPARVAEDAAETTLQLNQLQDWVNRQRRN